MVMKTRVTAIFIGLILVISGIFTTLTMIPHAEAAVKCKPLQEDNTMTCSGGGGSRDGGGSGGHGELNFETGEHEISGGEGGKYFSRGGHCEGNIDSGEYNCKGNTGNIHRE